ncbi:MAG: DUF2723 domain-containing protein [Gammaproteobacteria bacterium]|nr:DUF2723 domain-containing protein [Gammaproteobacteria bacterium]
MNSIARIVNAFPERIIFACAGFISLALYLLTTGQTVNFHDEAEFALRAYQLGATHSPGAPLFVLIGHMLGFLVPNPVLASSLVSVISAAITAGLVGVISYRLTEKLTVSVSGAMAFASIFTIWGNAIISEAYALSLLFVVWSTAVVFTNQKDRQIGSTYFRWKISLLYGFALAAHFANILLFPAYLLIFFMGKNHSKSDAAKFILVISLFVFLIAISNVLLAMNRVPFGEVSPDSLATVFLYMLGSQHDPLMIRGVDFYWGRISEHFLIFTRHYWFVLIPFGLIGAVQVCIKEQAGGLFLVMVYLIYMGYFTLFGSGDYFLMVGPAYFIFSVWVIVGLTNLNKLIPGRWMEGAITLVLLSVTTLNLYVQLKGRYIDAQSSSAEQYALEAFEIIPANSIVIARWSEFTALNYMQEVEGMRSDLRIMVPAREKRLYEYGEVMDYMAYVKAEICISPVVTNKVTEDIEEQYYLNSLGDIGDEPEWFQLGPKSPCDASK